MPAFAQGAFDGPYAGLNLGYVRGDDRDNEDQNGAATGYTTRLKPDAGLFGLALGYNRVFANNFVIGIEADAELRTGRDKTFYRFSGSFDTQYPVSTEVRNTMTLRPRAGYIFNENQTMAFVTAGIASASVRRSYGDTSGPTTYTTTDRHQGWTVGLGVEHLVRANITLLAEGRYSDYGTDGVSSVPIYGAGYNEKQDYTEAALRLGVRYHF